MSGDPHALLGLLSSFLTDGWVADCRCGWKSDPEPTMRMADLAHRAHSENPESEQVPR